MKVQFGFHEEEIEYNCSRSFFKKSETLQNNYLKAKFTLSDDEFKAYKAFKSNLKKLPIVSFEEYNCPKKVFGRNLNLETIHLKLGDIFTNNEVNILYRDMNKILEKRKEVMNNLKIVNDKLAILVSIQKEEVLDLAS